jgi:phosphatidylinositol alpha-1,6-mannosyltransferase
MEVVRQVIPTNADASSSATEKTDARSQVLLLTPSRGLGGGIERYAETVEWALISQGIQHERLDLRRAGPIEQANLLHNGRDALRMKSMPTQLVVAHRALLPVASILARRPPVQGLSVLCHGSEIWDGKVGIRRLLERHLMKDDKCRVVAVSSFTAGLVSRTRSAVVLPPGLSARWFQLLVDASEKSPQGGIGIKIVTAFRLPAWREKGLPELLSAISMLNRSDVRLRICGSGEPPSALLRALEGLEWCSLSSGLADFELAEQFATADLFVLATRTKLGRHASGEGFGLVLLEAQVAGTPVVAPAHGGSYDAFINEVTGLAPVDETARALAEVLRSLLKDPDRLASMGKRASEWAREAFAPERYAQLVVSKLL